MSKIFIIEEVNNGFLTQEEFPVGDQIKVKKKIHPNLNKLIKDLKEFYRNNEGEEQN